MPELCFLVTLQQGGTVSAILDTPDGFRAGATPVVVLAHGSGNDMRSAFLEFFATALCDRGMAVLRFNFPYKEPGGQRPPDRMEVLAETYRDVVHAASQRTGSPPGPLFVGGKSLGARVGSVVCAEKFVVPTGLVYLGYPLHPPGKPNEDRAEHLPAIGKPMLFVQGTRDPFGAIEEFRALRKQMRLAGALHVVEGGDHSFTLPKSQSVRQLGEMEGAADAVEWFVRKTLAPKRD